MSTATKKRLRLVEKRDAVPFRESLGKRKGNQRREIVIIEAGWGSSGYYSEDVLKRDGPRVFPAGTHMYLNHPTPREEAERPERSVDELVGKTVEDARMVGNQLVSVAEIYEHWVPVIDAMADDIGLSIRGYGTEEFGEKEGKSGPLITALLEAESIDYVTRAGAGGAIGRLIESARKVTGAQPIEEARNAANWFEARLHSDFTTRADTLFAEGHITREERIALSGAIGEALNAFNAEVKVNVPQLLKRDPFDEPRESEVNVQECGSGRPKEEDQVADDNALSELRSEFRQFKESMESKLGEQETKTKEAEARAERAEEALRLREAGQIVEAKVSEIEGIPSTARRRIISEALRGGDVPTLSDGSLDRALLEERAVAAIRAEQEYLADLIGGDGGSLEGSGRVRGVSESGSFAFGGGSSRQEDDDLEAVFQNMGLSESAAKRAAEGR